jgi:hypothetical protein
MKKEVASIPTMLRLTGVASCMTRLSSRCPWADLHPDDKDRNQINLGGLPIFMSATSGNYGNHRSFAKLTVSLTTSTLRRDEEGVLLLNAWITSSDSSTSTNLRFIVPPVRYYSIPTQHSAKCKLNKEDKVKKKKRNSGKKS